MTRFPTTRISLLMRVKDGADAAAWEEFAAIYRPVVCRFGRRRGLQPHDAEDLAQNVLSAVADRVAEWTPDESRGRFRTWLVRIAMNQTITMFRRRKPDAAHGGTTAAAALNHHPDHASELSLDYRRELFRRLAQRVREEFEEGTWQAFWMTAVENVSIEATAAALEKSAGSVYTARSRVIRRLQELARSRGDELDDITIAGEGLDD
jgi:RNA polymerase sigma-70 factor (ECF subfamily)